MKKLMLMVALSVSSLSQAAPILVNGSFDGTPMNTVVPTGWYTISETPDTVDASNNVGVNGLPFVSNPSVSSDGGSWVGLGRYDDNNSFIETFGQTINGFSIGERYSLSWLHGNFGYAFYTEANAIEILLDGIAIGSGGSIGLGSEWVEESISFLATGTSHELAFRLRDQGPSYHSIDGVKLSLNSVVDVSEPSLIALFGLAAGVVTFRRKRNA